VLVAGPGRAPAADAATAIDVALEGDTAGA
jgi:hypothetical protein